MNSENSTGGYWMLVGLVVLLALPMVIGHYTLASDTKATEHADASPLPAAD